MAFGGADGGGARSLAVGGTGDVADQYAQAAAVSRKRLDVEDAQAVPREHRLEREQREI